MSEETLDGGNANGGTPGTPTSGGSQAQSDSGSSGNAPELQASLEALTKRLDEIDQRSKALQSDKDRGVVKAQNEINELKAKFAEVEKLKKRGLNEDEAFEELELRDGIKLIREQLKANNPVQSAPAGNGNGQVIDRASVLSQYGLDGNDPDVAEALNGNFKSPLEMKVAALEVIYKRANKPSPDASAAPSVHGTPASGKDLRGDYIKEIEANRGNRNAIKAIQDKYRKSGFDPGSVGFSV